MTCNVFGGGRASEEKVRGLREAQRRRLREHVRGRRVERGRVAVKDLKHDHLIPHCPATGPDLSARTERQDQPRHLITDRQRQQLRILSRSEMLVVRWVHASRPDLDRHLSGCRARQFDGDLHEHLGAAKVFRYPPASLRHNRSPPGRAVSSRPR